MHGLDGGGHGFWMIVWWGLAIVSIVVLVWSLARVASSRRHRRDADQPEEVLERRYARGEIDRDTYRDRLRDLRA